MIEHDYSTIDQRLRRSLLFVITVSFALTPIAAPDFWWQLSRGRVAFSELAPPGPLLTTDTSFAEADWLGGLPFFLTIQFAGVSGLMLIKFIAAGLLAYWILRHFEARLNWTVFTIVVLAFVTANSAWQPTPRLFDCWFLLLTWLFTERWANTLETKKMLPVLLSLLAWANLAPLSLLGMGVVVCVPWLPGIRTETAVLRKQAGLLVLSALFAIMLTPRGWLTPYDSFIQLFPGLFYEQSLLALTVWKPTFLYGATIEVVGLSILTVGMVVYLLVASRGWIESIAFILFAIPAWTNHDCLGPCVTGICLLASQCLSTYPVSFHRLKLTRYVSPLMGRTLLAIGILVLCFKSASGTLPGQPQRLGWGITPELDITLLAQTIGPIDYIGTAHGMNIAATGMLTWIKADRKIRPVRTLRQALLQGKLYEELSLNAELSHGWEFQHPRADNSWGGWWIRLKNRNCQLLLVPNGDAQTIRALVDSRWQPMSIDASVIPFGWAGELLSSPPIVALLPVKDFLNRKQYTYSLPKPSGTPECSDWWGILTGSPYLPPAILQARTLRAMKLYTAALRVLHPLLQYYPSPAVRREFHLCQKELAYQEKLDIGLRDPSYLRSNASYDSASAADDGLIYAGPVIQELVEPRPEPDSLKRAIGYYIRGDWEAALNELTANDSESLYAKAQIQLESGNPDGAKETFRQLVQLYPDDQLANPSQNMLDSLQ
ncbi:tetratricopeptide repeat protein [Gimesia algae]|uniref:Uncharacterized protein n=1 Tax=Gimesia algae TaxID=2527971 RepID=A0A517VFM0_9PLAN|nr:tetratricopeptide repeat protein [Gimesia algae]QDT91802.1 hypothetical protein Pan161_34650 [Gimesia algae]